MDRVQLLCPAGLRASDEIPGGGHTKEPPGLASPWHLTCMLQMSPCTLLPSSQHMCNVCAKQWGLPHSTALGSLSFARSLQLHEVVMVALCAPGE